MSITEKDGWYVGEDQYIEWDIRDKPGNPVDITGWSIQFRMATTEGGSSILTKSGTVILTSRVRVPTLLADTVGFTPGTYFYTLSRTDGGFNNVLDSGTAELLARVV